MTATQVIVGSEYKDDSYHRIEVRVGNAPGDSETAENGIRILWVKDVDITSGCTIGHGVNPLVCIYGFFNSLESRSEGKGKSRVLARGDKHLGKYLLKRAILVHRVDDKGVDEVVAEEWALWKV